ncbi:alpha/beta hydrolase [Desulfobacula phenolica]|uniref:Pimeloyl-ACP methyl ester carboxylesterase n=1 Tax=Desulfobacula phenolica TaxID=90732 RepID=A0A1H2JS15_9BACT|nr:alpha/beta hydrolase [Desulfobacula phenolica]SDU59162.1 Pimeloyl-ACP methyl ester carboxylesterase [Desulfobacula phenolica]
MKTDITVMKKYIASIKNNKTIAIYLITAILCLLFSACAINNPATQNKKLTAQSADDSRIAYGTRGQGETTLLFVHGWLCDHKVWQPQIDYFSNHYKVAWLDLAGHGDSETNRQKFTMSAFAQDVKSVSDKVGGEKIILIGHSMGGPIVIETAKLLGEKVVGIVGVDAFYTPLASVPEAMKLVFLEKLKNNYPVALEETVKSMFAKSANPDLINLYYKNMLAADHKMGISSLYECIKWNSQKEPLELKKFSSKLYNINGAPTGKEKVLHESVVLISDVGHFVAQIKPDEFNAALEKIIENSKD